MNKIENAIEQLKSLKGICLYAEDGHEPPLVAIELSKVYDLAITALEAQQAVLQILQDEAWIPVSERLPEKSGYYLIQQECSIREYMRVGWYSSEACKFRCAEVKCYYEDIIAWKPLPTPYKEEQA